MKKLLLIEFLILLSFNIVFGQSLSLNWQQCFGGSEIEEARDIIKIVNYYYLVGWTNSEDGSVTSNHGGADGWIIKTDSSGNLIWEKCFGGTNSEGFERIFQDNEGYFYLMGSSDSFDGDISNDPYPRSTDYWIVKIDSSGNILWDRILGGNILDQMWTGTLTDDGGVVAFGWTGSPDGDVTEYFGAYDMWMVKLNSEGEKEWDFTIGTNDFDFGQAIIQTSDGGFLVGGASTIGEGGNLTCVPFNYNAEAILVKLDADRNIEWQQCYGGSDHDGVLALLELEDGYLISAYGGSADGDLTGSGWHGNTDVWVVRIDFWGNIIWQKCFGGSLYESALNIFKLSDGDFILIGNTESHDGDVTGNHTLSEYDNDIWIIKISSDGELISQQCIGGIGDERVDFGVIKKSDYNFVIAGQSSYGPSYDVTCTPHPSPALWPDFWVFEIKDTTVNVNENKVHENGIKVYPNPAKEYVVFKVPGISGKNSAKGILNELNTIQITNIFGLKVENNLPIKNEITVWDCRGVKPGIYFYKLTLENGIQCGKLIIQ